MKKVHVQGWGNISGIALPIKDTSYETEYSTSYDILSYVNINVAYLFQHDIVNIKRKIRIRQLR